MKTNKAWRTKARRRSRPAFRPAGPAARRGFTLVELLVVMGLFGLMMAVGIPAFQNLGRTSALDAATAQLRSMTLLARQWAITHRETIYVVFPFDDPGPPAAPELAYRAFSIFSYSDGYLRDWVMLPQGTVFSDEVILDNLGRGPTQNIFLWEDYYREFDSFSDPQPNLPAYSDGTFPRSPCNLYPIIRIMEGHVDAAGRPVERPGGEALYRRIHFYSYGAGIRVYQN